MTASSMPNPYDQPHPSPLRRRVASPAHWVALLAAPCAWIFQLLFNFSRVTHGCYPHAVPLAAPLWNDLRTTSATVTLAAVLVCLIAGAIGWQNWRRTREEKPGSAHDLLQSGDGRSRFLGVVGLLSSALFLVAVAVTFLAFTTVPTCGA